MGRLGDDGGGQVVNRTPELYWLERQRTAARRREGGLAGPGYDEAVARVLLRVEAEIKAEVSGDLARRDLPRDGDRSQNFDRYIAVHEAGHMVVADALGFMTLRVESLEDRVQVEVVPVARTHQEHFCAAAVALAGGLAQGLGGYAPDDGCLGDMGAALDNALGHLGSAAICGGQAVDGVLARASSLALCILKQRWRTVIDVADALDEYDGNLDHDNVVDLFDRLAREATCHELGVSPAHSRALRNRPC